MFHKMVYYSRALSWFMVKNVIRWFNMIKWNNHFHLPQESCSAPYQCDSRECAPDHFAGTPTLRADG